MMNLLPKTRLCGICYFPLPVDARTLDEPAVYRKRQPIWPPEEWVKGSPDDITKMSNGVDELHIKTTRILVQTSSKRGCSGCTAILECLANHIQYERILMDQDCLQDECKIRWAFGSSSDRRHSLTIRFTAAGREIKQVAMFLGYVGHIFQPLLSIHPAARKLRYDIVEGYTGSAASLKHLSQTLKECVSSHAHCRPSASALPYRVLELSTDIRSRISIRLIQGSNSRGHQYICLSHRWGPSTQNFRTMKSTLSLHLKSIQMADLPKTFQDAVKVTVFLGIKYLWIDSLCIIQDDDDDWKSQAAEMCNIYHGAYATLAANTSHDSTDGLFRTMQPKIAIPAHHSTYQKHFIFPDYSFLPGLSGHDYNGDFPLLGRGWVFQERILSRRFVQFAHEISVECAGHHFTHKDWKGSSDKAFHLHALESTDPIGILSHWHFLVGVFTGLNLTYQSDTLPALAGVARQYGKSHANVLGRYIAGLWENTLLQGLLWRVSPGHHNGVKRPDKYSAPTWSWASTTGQVGVLAYSRAKEEEFTIVSHDITLAGPDEYGPVSAGFLKANGYLATGAWRWSDNKNGRAVKCWVMHSKQARSQNIAQDFSSALHLGFHEVFFDYDLSIPGCQGYVAEGSPLYCLKTGFIGDGMHVCFILRAVDKEQRVFERVGLLAETCIGEVESWFQAGVAQELITIV